MRRRVGIAGAIVWAVALTLTPSAAQPECAGVAVAGNGASCSFAYDGAMVTIEYRVRVTPTPVGAPQIGPLPGVGWCEARPPRPCVLLWAPQAVGRVYSWQLAAVSAQTSGVRGRILDEDGNVVLECRDAAGCGVLPQSMPVGAKLTCEVQSTHAVWAAHFECGHAPLPDGY